MAGRCIRHRAARRTAIISDRSHRQALTWVKGSDTCARYTTTIGQARKDPLLIEARYNYEALHTGSLWVGRTFAGGEALTWEVTPMVGAVFGELTGAAPGVEASLAWRKLDFYIEAEYVFDFDSQDDSFFYAWSELGYSPFEWPRLGLVAQRTQVYRSDLEIQRGPFVRFTLGKEWFHMLNADVISMPDKWEYPWYAAWDLAFHTVALATVDFDFAKEQLLLMLRSLYFHPSGQIPAYEWNFSDVNPPVHAWATLWLYKYEKQLGRADLRFLERSFQGLMLNFNWWVNRKDPHWRDLVLFYEYFHGDSGAGLRASHQTGWTGLVAPLLDLFGRVDAKALLEREKGGVLARVFTEQVGGEQAKQR